MISRWKNTILLENNRARSGGDKLNALYRDNRQKLGNNYPIRLKEDARSGRMLVADLSSKRYATLLTLDDSLSNKTLCFAQLIVCSPFHLGHSG